MIELTFLMILGIILVALLSEFIDSSLGMLYGSILSPFLVIIGFSPLLIVPAILFSQAMGGFVAATVHHRKRNVDFSFKSKSVKEIRQKVKEIGVKGCLRRGLTTDLKISLCVVVLGIVATIISVLAAINIPQEFLKTYIGVLVIVMGLVLLFKTSFKFSWKKMIGIGVLGAFNKGISGGGFGPIVTSGQILSGRKGKNAIGVTTFTEGLVSIVGFSAYFFTEGIEDWSLLLLLTIGAVTGALFGPLFTVRFNSEKKLKTVLGALIVVLGVWTLAGTWFF